MKVFEAMFPIVYAIVFVVGLLKTYNPKDRTLLYGHIALMLVVGMLALVVYIHK